MLSDFLQSQAVPVQMQFTPPIMPELPQIAPKQKKQGSGMLMDAIMKAFMGGGGGAVGM